MIRKSHIKDVAGVAGFGLATSLGAKAVSSVPGGDASGVNALAAFNPVVGTLVGAKISLDLAKDVSKSVPIKSRKSSQKRDSGKRFSDAFFHYKYR